MDKLKAFTLICALLIKFNLHSNMDKLKATSYLSPYLQALQA